MNFLSMKYFLMLAEERSFTKAAERLHITQQTLSAHVAALERETGAKLFVRHVPLELTDSGAVFLRYARLFVRNELALKRELSDVSGRFEGILRIGIAPSRGQVMLPSVIARFQEQYPRCGIRLFEMANEDIWKGLKRDEIDIAMARLPGEMPGISHRPWMKEEIVLLVEKSLTERLWGKEGDSLFSEKERKKGLPLFFEDCPFLLNSEMILLALWRVSFSGAAALRPLWRWSRKIWGPCSVSVFWGGAPISVRKIWQEPCSRRRIGKSFMSCILRKGSMSFPSAGRPGPTAGR